MSERDAKVQIARLRPADGLAWQAFRLAALQREPDAFIASYEEEYLLSRSELEARLAPKDGCAWFGAYDAAELVGLVCMSRQSRVKSRHQALLSGMAVAPEYRGQGIGRRLLLEALAFARLQSGLRQVQLVVNASYDGTIGLYTSVGFQVFGREPGALLHEGVLHDGLHMVLFLNDSESERTSDLIPFCPHNT